MRLSINWCLYLIFFGTLLVINQIGWSQGQQGAQDYGLGGIERDGDSVKLQFLFCAANSSCERQTLTDDDGLASIVTVLSELKREYRCGEGVTNADDEVPHWDQISNFIEDRIIQLQDHCQEAVCRSDSRSTLETHGTNKKIYLMEYCGEVIRKSEDAFEKLYVEKENKITYRDLESLASLLDKAPYNLYEVSGQSTGRSIIGELGQESVVVGPIAEHHLSVQIFGATTSPNNRYFADGLRKVSHRHRFCKGVSSGRLAGLISNPSGNSSGSSGSGVN